MAEKKPRLTGPSIAILAGLALYVCLYGIHFIQRVFKFTF